MAKVTDFGAVGDGRDDSAAIQAAIDYVKGTYDVALGGFTDYLDFEGKMFAVDSSINATNIRQPGIRLENGGLMGRCAGKIVLDLAGTNSARLTDLKVVGDKANMPSVGIYYGRALFNGGYPISPNVVLDKVWVDGYFTHAALVNFASEVSTHSACRIANKNPALNAFAYANVGHAGALVDQMGGMFTSDYATLPAPANGALSNILHYEQNCQYLRPHDVQFIIQNITRANPAVVHVDAGELTDAGLVGGERVYFPHVVGMTQLNFNVYEVQNVDPVSGTFELKGVNSTGFDTFVSGYLRNMNGPAVLLNGAQGTTWEGAYVLQYGFDPIRVDLNNGVALKDCRLNMHVENNPRRIIDFHSNAAAHIERMDVELLNSYQNVKDAFLRVTGSGTVRIDGFKLSIATATNLPVNRLSAPVGAITVRGGELYLPNAALFSGFGAFSGTVFAADTNTRTVH